MLRDVFYNLFTCTVGGLFGLKVYSNANFDCENLINGRVNVHFTDVVYIVFCTFPTVLHINFSSIGAAFVEYPSHLNDKDALG